ncbi:MAG: hypothetical protein HFI34_11045 [Lachnospiraceae bacterium]|nr:hypothetical protein [Lachnospiraceae bacterium]
MSHMLFGDFNYKADKEQKYSLKRNMESNKILLFFDEEVENFKEVTQMLNENTKGYNSRFCITSVLQKYNSDDILFPYDKHSDEDLFPNGDDRKHFEKLCYNNLKILQNVIETMKQKLDIDILRIFVVEGYDTNFVLEDCNIYQMINSIYLQIKESFFLESSIYKIKK